MKRAELMCCCCCCCCCCCYYCCCCYCCCCFLCLLLPLTLMPPLPRLRFGWNLPSNSVDRKASISAPSTRRPSTAPLPNLGGKRLFPFRVPYPVASIRVCIQTRATMGVLRYGQHSSAIFFVADGTPQRRNHPIFIESQRCFVALLDLWLVHGRLHSVKRTFLSKKSRFWAR